MEFSPGADPEFRARIRTFLERNLTDDMIERAHASGTMHDWDLHRAVAREGLLAAAWPPEVGGAGRSPFDMLAVTEEFNRAGAPIDGWITTTMVARTLLVVGTDEQQQSVVPRVLDGDLLICLGYSEPESGSDVAAARTRAVQDDHGWVITGQKMFTTLAHESEYVFLLARTNPSVAKRRELTMFLVPLDAEGVEIQPMHTVGGERTNVTFYNDVRVPDSARVGEVDGGWDVMKVALTFERDIVMSGQIGRLLDQLTEWCRSNRAPDDRRVTERLGRACIDREVADLLVQRQAWMSANGGMPVVEGSMAKLYSSEAFGRCASDALDLVGTASAFEHGAPQAPLRGELAHAFRHAAVLTIYGGTSEIQRSIIAERHLGLPRSR